MLFGGVASAEEVEQYVGFFRIFDAAVEKPEEIIFFLDGEKTHLTPSKEILNPGGRGKLYEISIGNIGKGGCKQACVFGENVCLIPNDSVDSLSKIVPRWKRIIREEKKASDEVARVGLKTQDFTISTLSVKDPSTDKYYSIEVLKTKNFYTLAKEQRVTIVDSKGKIFYGLKTDFYGNKSNLDNIFWNKEMFQNLMNEIMLALSYAVPCEGDTRNFYLTHPINSESPPVVHLFLYDFSSKVYELKFPLLRNFPILPKEEKVFKKFKDVLGSILSMITKEESDKLGFQYSDFGDVLLPSKNVNLLKSSKIQV